MALAIPSVYLAAVESRRSGETEGRVWRLPPNHVQDLRDVACGVEETNAGVCCRYLVDQLAGGGSSDVDGDGYVHHLEDVERFVERFGDFGRIPQIASWRQRIARCRRALARLRHGGDHRSADVLMVAYGHLDPSTEMLVPLLAPEHANLARYVDAVEARRLELVREEVSRWQADRADDAVDLPRRRAVHAWADKSISSGVALLAALAPFLEPACAQAEGEPRLAFEARKEARRERQDRHARAREAFLLAVKLDAHRLLVAAEQAYHRVWLASATRDFPGER